MGDELMQTMQEVDATPRLIVEVMTSTLAGRRFAFTAMDLKRGVLLGRASDCHIRFDASKDLKVSGHHAMIDERDGKIMVRDQGSSNGVYLNDVRVTAAGAALLSGSKLALGQEGAIMKLLLPGQSSSKTSQGVQASPSAPAPMPPAERPLKPAPGTGQVPIAAPHAPVAAPTAPPPQAPAPPAGESARRGMPSVQTDPALLKEKHSSIDRVVEQVGSKVGAGDKTKYLLKEVAEQLESRARRKSGAMATLIGALVLLLLAACAIGVWYVMEQQKKEERGKAQQSAQEEERKKVLDDIRKDVDSMKASSEAVANMAAGMEAFRREQERKLEEVAKGYGGSAESQDALLRRLKEIEDNYAKGRAALEHGYRQRSVRA